MRSRGVVLCARALAASVAVALVLGVLAAVPGPGGPASVRAAEPGSVEPGSAADASVRLIYRGPRSERVVALTFDDGYNPRVLRRIYTILVREHVPATFFVTGMYVQRAPDLWRTIGARFGLANHSYRHRDTRKLTPAQAVADLARARTVVERTTGHRMLPYFRPPYGYRTAATDRLAAAAGFPFVVLWNVVGADTAAHPTTASVVRNATKGGPGSIILLHAGPSVTARALPAIIARYRARGFRFVALPALIGLPAVRSALPAGPGVASRSMDRRDGMALAASAETPDGAPGAADGRPVPPPPAAVPAVPAIALPGGTPPPPARAVAWVRGPGARPMLAVATVAFLLLALVAAAVVGRRTRVEAIGG